MCCILQINIINKYSKTLITTNGNYFIVLVRLKSPVLVVRLSVGFFFF